MGLSDAVVKREANAAPVVQGHVHHNHHLSWTFVVTLIFLVMIMIAVLCICIVIGVSPPAPPPTEWVHICQCFVDSPKGDLGPRGLTGPVGPPGRLSSGVILDSSKNDFLNE